MKIRSILKTMVWALFIIMFITIPSFAAVEIKDTSEVLTSQTVSEYYLAAKNMDNEGEGLEHANVDVHMANNKEWATLSYFSNSIYGTEGEGQNTGIEITTNDNTHYTTNGNATGVMDWRKVLYIYRGCNI